MTASPRGSPIQRHFPRPIHHARGRRSAVAANGGVGRGSVLCSLEPWMASVDDTGSIPNSAVVNTTRGSGCRWPVCGRDRQFVDGGLSDASHPFESTPGPVAGFLPAIPGSARHACR